MWLAVAHVLFAGCATVGSTVSSWTGGEASAARSFGTTTRGAMPASTTSAPTSYFALDKVSIGAVDPVVETSTWLDRPSDPGTGSLAAWAFERPEELQAWGKGRGKSFLIPAVDIVGFEFLLNQLNRQFNSEDVYRTDFASIEHNLHSGWVIDNDPFATNQFLHPYQGSVYHGFARSAGLNYWEALGYDFGGSALWEIAGETVPPSLNDQLTTTFAGSFLGEALFRMASRVLEVGGERPGFFRRLGAALISPSTSFNRLAYGERFDGVFKSDDPAIYTRVGVGASRHEQIRQVGVQGNVPENEFVGEFAIDYGLPGKPTYDYKRPFDYFHFEATAVSSIHSLPEDVAIQGLLCGSKYEVGHSYRGVWGLYGGFDYISPEVFAVSSTSISLGTTGQWWFSDELALQGTATGGVGWTAAGTVADAAVDRDYHYGISPQALVALRVIFGKVAVLDMTGRDFYVGSLATRGNENSETILRGKIALTVRVYGRHAIGVQYVASSRDARYSDLPDTTQSIGAVSVFYTYISDTKFGAVEW